MAEPVVMRFGECELHLARRELTRRDEPQALPPKVYQLLVLLLRERQRVLPHAELAATLWKGAHLSGSVLARTVMKLRRAIGDCDGAPPMVKTLRGVGYRFVGAVVEVGAEARLPLPPRARLAPRARPRVGVLPCVNDTGDAALDWVGLGLATLVGHALEQEPRLAVVPVAALLDALPPLRALPAGDAAARLAVDALGLQHVLQATLRRDGRALVLDHVIHHVDASPASASLRGADLLLLGERCANAARASVLPGAAAAELRLLSRDPFVNQAFGRATDLFIREAFEAALPLFDVVCGLAPDNLVAQLWQLRCLAMTQDAHAVQLGRSLLARARDQGDVQTQASAHALLAAALSHGAAAPAGAVRRPAGSLGAGLAAAQDGASWLFVHSAIEAGMAGDRPRALRLLEQAEAAAHADGSASRLAQVQQNLGWIEAGAGNPAKAGELLESAVRLHRRLGHGRSLAHALSLLAGLNASLGRFDRAFEHGHETLDLLQAGRNPPQVGPLLAACARIWLEFGAAAPVGRALALFDSVDEPASVFARAPRLAVRASVALCRGEHEAAAGLLEQAIDAGLADFGADSTFLRLWWPLLLRVRSALGDDAALATATERALAVPAMRASVLHAQAAGRLAHGERAAAARLLAQVLALAPPVEQAARAQLDAAWLAAEEGDAAGATQALADAGAWRDQHPAGLAAQARLLLLQGRPDAAARRQLDALDRHRGSAPAWHLAAWQCYLRSEPPPPLAQPLCDSWLLPRNPAISLDPSV